MRHVLLLILTLLLIAGCTHRPNDIGRGISNTHVQTELGLPDVISDFSGDKIRYYSPHNRPAYDWPVGSPRTYYYIARDLKIRFVHGQAVEIADIDDRIEERLLRDVSQSADPQ